MKRPRGRGDGTGLTQNQKTNVGQAHYERSFQCPANPEHAEG